jgi:hypothetical protein
MSQANDFARRLLADFVAARLEARSVEAEQLRPMRQGSHPAPSARMSQDSSPRTNHSDRAAAGAVAGG